MTNFTIEIEDVERQGRARLLVAGELDISSALTFRRKLRALRSAHRYICVDLSQLEFIDSAGAHALNDAVAQSRNGGGRVEVAPRMSDQAKRFFDLMTAAGVATSF